MRADKHRADGLYAFSLAQLDAKGLFACAWGREMFHRAVKASTGKQIGLATEVPMTLQIAKAMLRFNDDACPWLVRRMEALGTVSCDEFDLIHEVSQAYVAETFMDILYNRAVREGLIQA